MTTSKFSDREKAECARREANQRKRVYSQLIDAGRMDPARASRELDLMREIEQDYRERMRESEPTLL